MYDNSFTNSIPGTALTEAEMADVTGGASPLLYGLGFITGLGAAMVRDTATNTGILQYCFGA